MARAGFALVALAGATVWLVARAGKREQPDEYVLGGDGWVHYEGTIADVFLA